MTPFSSNPAMAAWLARYTIDEHIRETAALRRSRRRHGGRRHHDGRRGGLEA